MFLLAAVGLYKSGLYRFDFLKKLIRQADFTMDTKELKIPEDALSFSVYDMQQNRYLFLEGEGQLPTVASLTKLFTIDYALTRVSLDEIVVVNQELLDLVPADSSLANLKVGQYTVKQLMQGMLIPSGNDAAYALAEFIAQKDLGGGHTAREYVDYFTEELRSYLVQEGYDKTDLYDPSGYSLQSSTQVEEVNRVTLKLLQDPFIRECVGQSTWTIQTPQGELTWKNSNEFLDPNSPYYNENIKGVKTGTMASSYSLIALYEKDGKQYLITCLASTSNENRYKAVQSAINTILSKDS